MQYSVQSAIGQGTNNFTVSQLNRYVTAVANRGNCLQVFHLLTKTTDSERKDLIKDYDSGQWSVTMDEVSAQAHGI